MTETFCSSGLLQLAFAEALRTHLRGVTIEGKIRSFVTRILVGSGTDNKYSAQLPNDTENDRFTTHQIVADSWLPAMLSVFSGVIETHEDITTMGQMLVATPTTIETHLAFCASGKFLMQLMTEEPFVNVVDVLNDICAGALGRGCLLEAFAPLQELEEAMEDRLFFVVLKVMR